MVAHPARFERVPDARPVDLPLFVLFGGRLSARCPHASGVPRGFQPAPVPDRLVFPKKWRSAEVSIPARCRARVFKTRCRAVGKRSLFGVLAVTRTPISGFGRQGSVRLSYENVILSIERHIRPMVHRAGVEPATARLLLLTHDLIRKVCNFSGSCL
jgi:hypothetical protein